MVTVVPAMVQMLVVSDAYVMARFDDALAVGESANVAPCTNARGVVCAPNDIVWLPCTTLKLCGTVGAALKLASPNCCAVIEQVPRLMNVTSAPDAEHTAGVVDTKLTVSDDVAVALSASGANRNVCVPGLANEIVWLVFATVNVKACDALGMVVLAAPKVSGKVPACVGVPESTPVVVLNASPDGNVPVIEKVNVDGVPVAVTLKVVPA